MNVSYDTPSIALVTNISPAVLPSPPVPTSSSNVSSTKSSTNVTAESEDDTLLKHLFGDPSTHGEKEDMKKRRKQ
jgi:hypothetical protein